MAHIGSPALVLFYCVYYFLHFLYFFLIFCVESTSSRNKEVNLSVFTVIQWRVSADFLYEINTSFFFLSR